ncbi:MAG: tyrosine-protein phosphatase [Verrucomicrobia bacterium]|nr:tyrosine-protein phosphatase [Verrucomicrobiota bacterium]
MAIRPSTETAPAAACLPPASQPKFSFEITPDRCVILSPAFSAHIKEEFKSLCSSHPRLLKTLELAPAFLSLMAPEAFDPRNQARNRYNDILPYPPNRFKFRQDPTLYINASIVLKGKAISCQGPKTNEFKRFWRMVWEFDARAVVMATDFVEGNAQKCDRYFPSKDGESLLDASPEELPIEQDIRVVKTEGPELPIDGMPAKPSIVLRKILLQKGSEKKIIEHLSITGWRDNEAANESLVAEAVRLGIGKRIVAHCSAGIGRTGVFLAIKEALEQFQQGLPVTPDFILGILKSLRSQEQGRNGMVQTVAQYELIFKTLILLDENFGKELCQVLNRSVNHL